MIDIEVKITDKGKNKLYKKAYNQVKSQVLKDVGEEMYDYIKMGGLGVRLGRVPTGGAPVWETRPENDPTDAVPRELLNSHRLKIGRDEVSITSTSDYVLDVIMGIHSQHWMQKYGTGMFTSGENHYHKRAVDTILKSDAIKDNLSNALLENQLK